MKIKRFLIFLVLLLVIAGGGFFYVNNFASDKTAKLEINSNISTDIFVDGKNVGHDFPYIGTYEPKMVVVKIGDYETNVYLQPGIKTVVNRDFKDNVGYGEIVSFEKTGQSYPAIIVISNPSNAIVNIDGKNVGVTPFSLDDIGSGSHRLDIALDGYVSRGFQINTYNGYKLLANFQLLDSSIRKQEETATQKEKTIVKILQTPNGFLRVRKEPTTQSEEVFRAHENDEYELVSRDMKNGWFEIRIDASRSGWISDIYASTTSGELKKP